jgi:transcriptional antiterminator NusG
MHWYLVYTICWHEKKVMECLERKGFETFLPVVERPSQKNPQERITVPLFPSYLLVRAEMNADTYLKILKTDGVVGFFRNNRRPVIIPDEQVNDIRDDKDINLFPNSKEDIKV